MPKISVIMGIYNTPCKEYLEKSIGSILKQTFMDFEFIICNDGSTNDCMNWAKQICDNDTRVIFIENERNKGLAYTLNHCLEYASGEYIARMDDDDESNLNRLDVQNDFLDKNPQYDLVASNVNFFYNNIVYAQKKFSEVIDKKDFLFNSPIVHPSILVRKSAYKKVNGYRDIKKTIRNEDYDLFMRMYAKQIRMYTIQEMLFNYREDKNTYKKRKKYKYRINEARVRFENYFKLHLYPIGIIYVLKPLIVGLIPQKILASLKKEKIYD